MKLSVLIPAHNEELSIADTVLSIADVLTTEKIDHELIVVTDHCQDQTETVCLRLQKEVPQLKIYDNPGERGFGRTIRFGLDKFDGDCVALMMADGSDLPRDLITFYHHMSTNDLDCVFGSRFIQGAKVTDYPKLKLVLNRMANYLVKWVFRIPYNDCTNAFKLYHRRTINGIMPLLSPHFNLTLEMPLKAIVRGYSFSILPNQWRNRKHGQSNLKIKEMGSRYFFIFLYCLIEKYFSKGDYKKK